MADKINIYLECLKLAHNITKGGTKLTPEEHIVIAEKYAIFVKKGANLAPKRGRPPE